MALHRDIFWVGRQWAVTGYGLQAVNQELKGKFDIEAARLWQDGLLESMRAEAWLNAEDFAKALSVARKQFPEQPGKTAPPEERVLGLIDAVLQETRSKQQSSKQTPIEAPQPAAQKFDLRIEGSTAKFVAQWRIRIKR